MKLMFTDTLSNVCMYVSFSVGQRRIAPTDVHVKQAHAKGFRKSQYLGAGLKAALVRMWRSMCVYTGSR